MRNDKNTAGLPAAPFDQRAAGRPVNIGIFISGDVQYWRPLADQTFLYLEKHLGLLNCKINLINPQFINQRLYHQLNIDCAFIAQHDMLATKGYTQALLDIENIDYVGCGVEAANKTYNKKSLKKILGYENIPVTAYREVSRESSAPYGDAFDFSSTHIKISTLTQKLWYGENVIDIRDTAGAEKQIQECFKFCDTALIEPYSPETVHMACIVVNRMPLAIVKRESNASCYPYRYTADYSLSPADELQIEQFAEKACDLLALEGLVQIDFQVCSEFGVVLENILTHPPIYPGGSFVTALDKANADPGAILESLIREAGCYCVI
ncbi:hypothetical protein [Photobacterium gaetbulicola]|uniref:Uncharacterized protein n=1 Tax=Photobacterium gaetbulicola Gung47 TaxID=658445 RepID=A0A0C4JN25_9GAMM|nr:hypothetical protein [Photobacterium gaetbulicola]AHA59190.1 hypothetical protein H744_p0105 [Photobacterium gaetbulicola Gung47]